MLLHSSCHTSTCQAGRRFDLSSSFPSQPCQSRLTQLQGIKGLMISLQHRQQSGIQNALHVTDSIRTRESIVITSWPSIENNAIGRILNVPNASDAFQLFIFIHFYPFNDVDHAFLRSIKFCWQLTAASFFVCWSWKDGLSQEFSVWSTR